MISAFFRGKEAIRAADAKEVGVGNPAEETYRYPNQASRNRIDNPQLVNVEKSSKMRRFHQSQL
jgi:hypothetical protein